MKAEEQRPNPKMNKEEEELILQREKKKKNSLPPPNNSKPICNKKAYIRIRHLHDFEH